MSRAVRLCPSLVIVRPDFQKYRQVVAAGVRALPRGHAAGRAAVARRGLPRRHRERLGRAARRRGGAAAEDARFARPTGLTASAGVAPNKFLAKIASGWQKPDGLTVIAPERVERFLQGLPVDALWGVGPVTAKKLQAHGITRLVDVRAADLETLRGLVGSLADWLKDLAEGRDARPVEPDRPSKSSGSECTYEHDLTALDEIRKRDRRDGRRRRGVAGAARPLRAHRGHQGALQRLRDDHPQPQRRTDARARGDHRTRAWRCSTRPKPAGGRCGCSAPACTTSRATESPRGPPGRTRDAAPDCPSTTTPDPPSESGAQGLTTRTRLSTTSCTGASPFTGTASIFLDHVEPLFDPAEHRVLVVEHRRRGGDDEERGAGGVGLGQPGHRHHAEHVLLVVELRLQIVDVLLLCLRQRGLAGRHVTRSGRRSP